MRSDDFRINYRIPANDGAEGSTRPRTAHVKPDGTIYGIVDEFLGDVTYHLDTDAGFNKFVEFIQSEAKKQAQKEIRNALGIR